MVTFGKLAHVEEFITLCVGGWTPEPHSVIWILRTLLSTLGAWGQRQYRGSRAAVSTRWVWKVLSVLL